MNFDINMTQIHRQGMTLQVNNICWLGTPTVDQDVIIRYPLNSDKKSSNSNLFMNLKIHIKINISLPPPPFKKKTIGL